ncbi:MAG: PHP domain-containing protein, partial [Spirochaetaceae bacterium]|nr:PHP domain-containing protein [Spirochaetaceae bacterium]
VRLSEAKRLEELARKLGFFVTAGSDFHGEKVRADRKIGHTAGGLKIDSRFWQDELSVQLKNI